MRLYDCKLLPELCQGQEVLILMNVSARNYE